MRKDYILTPEEKKSKEKRLEENRQLRSTIINNTNIKLENISSPIENQNIQSVKDIFLLLSFFSKKKFCLAC